jgi:Tfp pilus assembly protein PilO
MKRLKRISRSQKRIIIATFVIMVVFSGFWVAMYVPTQKGIDRLKAELEETEGQIRQIEAMIAQGKGMGEGIQLMEGQYQQLMLKFPSKEEGALIAFFDLAFKVNVEIITIRTQPKRLCRQQVTTEGKSCYELPVSFELRGGFGALIAYIELLKGSLPAFITFEKINISPGKSGTSELSISLEIQLYLLA